jgi:hypothetical protein
VSKECRFAVLGLLFHFTLTAAPAVQRYLFAALGLLFHFTLAAAPAVQRYLLASLSPHIGCCLIKAALPCGFFFAFH